jgi:hypothetical protein
LFFRSDLTAFRLSIATNDKKTIFPGPLSFSLKDDACFCASAQKLSGKFKHSATHCQSFSKYFSTHRPPLSPDHNVLVHNHLQQLLPTQPHANSPPGHLWEAPSENDRPQNDSTA